MSTRIPESVRKLNDVLRADLGSNPLYAWRWSNDLRHVMNKIDTDGNQLYKSKLVYPPGRKEPLVIQVRDTAIRQLLPFHTDCWIACGLIETDAKDGSLEHTGVASWVPISSSRSGPAALPPNMVPTMELTQCVIAAVRAQRQRTLADDHNDFDDLCRKRESDRFNRTLDIIKDAGTAFHAVPGRKGHVSFGGVDEPLVTL